MRIPINIRVTALTPRLPGGSDQVQIVGEALSGGIIFAFRTTRLALAETLALDAREGSTISAQLSALDMGDEDEPANEQAAEQEERGTTIRV